MFRQGYEHAKAYAEDPRGWLVLTGTSGSGKTHLAAAIANRVLERGCPAFFVFVPDLLDHLRSAFSPSSDISFDQLFEQVRSAPFLVLDDLGGHSGTQWAREKLYQILNFRYTYRMPTVFTLGAPLEELETRWQTRLADTEIATTRPLSVAERGELSSRKGSLNPEYLARMTFDSFHLNGNGAVSDQLSGLKQAYERAQRYAENPSGWLVFLGPTGCGKTHLVYAIANERLKQGKGVVYFLVANLLDYLRETYNPESTVTYDRLFEEVRNSPLLVLEDLGGHNPTPWAMEKLYQIVVHRHDYRLPTIITTTLPKDGNSKDENNDEKYPTIRSRMLDHTVVETLKINAPDYRDRSGG